jgi:GH35 family endo-1,4-beta-xylanase
MKFLRTALLCVFAMFLSCSSDIDPGDIIDDDQHEGRYLREIVAEKFPTGNVYIGATAHYRDINNVNGDLLNREFSYITPANDFKQSYVHPTPDTWKWLYPDAWVTNAISNEQKIRSHGPISPQCSSWAKDDSRTPEELMQNLEEYVTELCKRYNNEPSVVWMDVVNETALDDNNASWFGPKEGTTSWQNPWTQIGFEENIPPQFTHLGGRVPVYIIRAFEIANEFADNKKLIINQHGSMNDALWNKMKDLILYLRHIGLRVDGIGWQAHIKYNQSSGKEWANANHENYTKLAALIDWAHANDLEFHVTENNIHDLKSNPYSEEEYAAIFTNILSTVLSKRNSGVVTWNLWTLADLPHYNNDNLDVVGLWDAQLNPRKAYRDIQSLLESY